MKPVILVPTHIAIIMDGNRRWAKEHNLPALSGHRKVADVILEMLVEHASKRGIKYITFWVWSTENWRRNKKEIEGIMSIFRHVIKKRWKRLHEKGVRIKIIGDISRFPKDIQKSFGRVIEETKKNSRITAIFALNYGGRDEILRAISRLQTKSKFEIRNSKFSEQNFASTLDTAGIPDPDLIIRPGGEQRLSGFMLWQCAYSELYFPKWYMPEFTKEKLDEAIEEYGKRQRRFGK